MVVAFLPFLAHGETTFTNSTVLLEDEDNEVMGGGLRYMYQSSVGEGYDQLAPLDLVIVRKTCLLDTLCLIYAWRSFRGTTGVRSRRTRGSPGPRNTTNNDEYGCTVLQSINRPDSGLICYICSHGRPCRQLANAPFSRSLLRFAPCGRDPSTLQVRADSTMIFRTRHIRAPVGTGYTKASSCHHATRAGTEWCRQTMLSEVRGVY